MLGRAYLLVLLVAILASSACSISLGKASPAPQPTVDIKVATPTINTVQLTPTPHPEPAIVVTAPIAGQVVGSPVRVAGSAQVFEGTVLIAIKDATGKVVGKGFTTATAGAPERGTFSADIAFTPLATSQAGTVEVYAESPKDGSVRDLLAIKVTLAGR